MDFGRAAGWSLSKSSHENSVKYLPSTIFGMIRYDAIRKCSFLPGIIPCYSGTAAPNLVFAVFFFSGKEKEKWTIGEAQEGSGGKGR